MDEDVLDRLRYLARELPPDPRDLYEWTVPTKPSDLRWILAQYDALKIANEDLKNKISELLYIN